jgi:hypothetical protein
MKPPEILGMLEEAAGTRMFESKKEVGRSVAVCPLPHACCLIGQAALKTIEKKQVKVDEINRVLAEDIKPTLDKLRYLHHVVILFLWLVIVGFPQNRACPLHEVRCEQHRNRAARQIDCRT